MFRRSGAYVLPIHGPHPEQLRPIANTPRSAARRPDPLLQALAPQKRGPKSKRDPLAEENQQLRRETQRITEELRKAEIVIDIQKKVATLLGRRIMASKPEEKP